MSFLRNRLHLIVALLAGPVAIALSSAVAHAEIWPNG